MPGGFYVLGLVVVGVLCLVIAVASRRAREQESRVKLLVPGYCVHCDYHAADHHDGLCPRDTPTGRNLPVGTRFEDQCPPEPSFDVSRREYVKAVLDQTGDDVDWALTWKWPTLAVVRNMNKRLNSRRDSD